MFGLVLIKKSELDSIKTLSEVRRQAVEELAHALLEKKHKWTVFAHRITEQALRIGIELEPEEKADESR